MSRLVNAIEAGSDYVDKTVLYLVFAVVFGMVIVTTLQVVCRVFFSALTWSEELSRYLLVWGTFFGATMAYKRGNHIAITFVIELLPKKLQPYFVCLGYVLSLAFFAVVGIYGWQMIQLQVFQISPAIGIPMQYVYVSLPTSLAIMMVHALSGIARQLHIVTSREGAA